MSRLTTYIHKYLRKRPRGLTGQTKEQTFANLSIYVRLPIIEHRHEQSMMLSVSFSVLILSSSSQLMLRFIYVYVDGTILYYDYLIMLIQSAPIYHNHKSK